MPAGQIAKPPRSTRPNPEVTPRQVTTAPPVTALNRVANGPYDRQRGPLTVPTILQLQRAIGNRATGEYLAKHAPQPHSGKLQVQRATDPAEREAEQVAKQVSYVQEPHPNNPYLPRAGSPAIHRQSSAHPVIQRRITTRLVGGVMEQEQQDEFDSTDPVILGRLWKLMNTYWRIYPIGDKGTMQDEYRETRAIVGGGKIFVKLHTLYEEINQAIMAATGTLSATVAKVTELERFINTIQTMRRLVSGNLAEVFSKLPADVSLLGELNGTIRSLPNNLNFNATLFSRLLDVHKPGEISELLRQLSSIDGLPRISLIDLLAYGDLVDIVEIYGKGDKTPSDQILMLVRKMEQVPRIDRLKVFAAQQHVMGGATPQTRVQAVKLLQYGTLQELHELLTKFFVGKTDKLIQELESEPALSNVPKKLRMHVYLNEHLRPDPKSERTPMGFKVSDSDPSGNDLTALVNSIRDEQRTRKQKLESKLTGKLNALDKDDPTRSQLIKEHATNLKSIGLSKERLESDRRFKDLIKNKNLKYDSSTGKITKEDTTEVGSIYSSDQAFDPNPIVAVNVPNGIHRAVYQKRGKKPGKTNEYVKDDQNVYTHRYIYIEKNRFQFRDLLSEGSIRGRYPTDPSQQSPQPYNAITPDLRQQVPDLPNKDKFESPYQLAYVHQELGSGIQQRGVSASATGKYNIFSNQGLPFKTNDGVRFEVDLARVPRGRTDEVPEVINHYAPGAQANMKNKIDKYKIQKRDHQRQFEHYQWSVTKNREIFMKEIKPEYLSSITLHKTIENKSHTETSNTGFSQQQLAELGKKVGVPAYNLGFMDGTAGNDSQSDTQPKEMQKFYDEGYADGQEYLKGYQKGQAYRRKQHRGINRSHAQGQVYNDQRVRFVQGYWDGVYNRRMKTYH